MDGFLLVRKPKERTSFQTLTPMKKLLPRTKIGHTGTLDRFAEGLLVVLCGRMTKLTPLLTGLDKTYVGEICFGRETATLDPEGETVAEAEVPSPEAMREAIMSFVGPIDQIPPQYSAIHVDGERAYRAARAGRSVTIAPRRVTIHDIEVLDIEPPYARVRVDCSSGTYIRALARDIGRKTGSRAYLSNLLRTRVGPFSLSDALPPEEIARSDLKPWEACFDRFPEIERLQADSRAARRLTTGGKITDEDFEHPPADGRAAVYDAEGVFLALVEREKGQYRYEIVATTPTH